MAILKLYKPDATDMRYPPKLLCKSSVDMSSTFCFRAQKLVCCNCYKVIEVFLQGDSRKNELYVSRFVPFFEEQVS